MNHHTGVESIVGSHVEKLDLPSSSLFSRRSDQNDLPEEIELLHSGSDPEKSSDSSDGDKVVTTSMSNTL